MEIITNINTDISNCKNNSNDNHDKGVGEVQVKKLTILFLFFINFKINLN
jgi:hypothetical protein